MNRVKYLFVDLFKCIGIGFIISLAIAVITGLIAILFSWGNILLSLEWVKRVIYFIGGLGLFLSAGAFLQRDATRPFVYNEEWKAHFKIFNIGFVMMLISFSVLVFGMMVHNLLDFGRVF